MWQWKGAPRAMGPLTQPHPWLRDPEWGWHSASLALVVYQFHQHLLCFSKEATKKQITEQKSDPLDWLHSWMFWEYDPHLWKNSIFCNFTRARECIIIVEDLENHLQRGSRNWKEKKDDWDFVGQLLWRPEPSPRKFHKRGNNGSCVISDRRPSPPWYPPLFRALQPLSLTLELYIPSNALFISLLATWW